MSHYVRARTRRLVGNMLTYIALLLAIGLAIFPLIWMVGSSLSLPSSTFGGHLDENAKPDYSLLIPSTIHFGNYQAVFAKTNFLLYFRNTIIVAGVTTGLSIIVGVLGGYALSRYRFKGRMAIGQTLLAMYMFPPVLLIIPIFLVLKTIGVFDSLLGLIIAYTTFCLPFCVWMLKGYFDSIPPDLEEQAMVDGCSKLGSMLRVLLPLSGAGLASTAIFSFILAWNEFMFANAFIQSDEWKTVTVGLPTFAGQYLTELGIMLASSTLVVIPMLIFFLLLQKWIVQGLTAGAIKG
jgi:multiple sugar transport system permease protein